MRSVIRSILFASLVGSSLPTSAEVFKCVDEATGKTTFTDTACLDKSAGEYIHVKRANADSGYAAADEIDQRRREDETRQQAKVKKMGRVAEEHDKRESVASHQKQADRLDTEARFEKDIWKRSMLHDCVASATVVPNDLIH